MANRDLSLDCIALLVHHNSGDDRSPTAWLIQHLIDYLRAGCGRISILPRGISAESLGCLRGPLQFRHARLDVLDLDRLCCVARAKAKSTKKATPA
jgi:hypothetical protein